MCRVLGRALRAAWGHVGMLLALLLVFTSPARAQYRQYAQPTPTDYNPVNSYRFIWDSWLGVLTIVGGIVLLAVVAIVIRRLFAAGSAKDLDAAARNDPWIRAHLAEHKAAEGETRAEPPPAAGTPDHAGIRKERQVST